MAHRGSPVDELAAHERRLRRTADAHAVQVGDPDLTEILGYVRDRRSRRSMPSGRSQHGAGARGHEVIRGDAPTSGAPGEVLAIEEVGSSVRIFRVGRPVGFGFRAGQYAKVGVDGRTARDLSIASAPHEPHLELCVELNPGGRLTPALFGLDVGAHLEIGDRAKGSFRLDETAGCHLMVATVTGIAPLRSMVRDARHRGLGGEIIVLHGASHADELPYRAELEALAEADPSFRYVPSVSRPEDPRNRSWQGETGRVDPLALRVARDLAPRATRVYACGNAGMVRHVADVLGSEGFAVSTESFD